MHKRHIASAALLLLAAIGFVGCDDAPEEGRALIAVTMNGGAPIESDVSADSLVFEDFVPVEFFSRAFNEFITAPRGDVIIETYRVTWERTDGGSGTLPPREESLNLYLPLNESVSTTIRLVTWGDKSGPVLGPILGTNSIVTMKVTVEFTCREVGTEAETKTTASATVTFADTV